MQKNPERKVRNDLKKADEKDKSLINPMPGFSPYISYRYSYRSVFSDGEKTHIHAKENRFENGRFESEEFEGTLPHNVYVQMQKNMYRYFRHQMDLLLRPFSFFLPKPPKDKT